MNTSATISIQQRRGTLHQEHAGCVTIQLRDPDQQRFAKNSLAKVKNRKRKDEHS